MLGRIADDQLGSLCSCEALQKTRIPHMSADSSNRSRSAACNLVHRCPEGPKHRTAGQAPSWSSAWLRKVAHCASKVAEIRR